MRIILAFVAIFVLLLVFSMYLDPTFWMNVSDLVWSCF
ncbi:Uncharacterised protein [Oligella ureolytica]|uniref:Uncharacterized protein n=1 Tax=Oligella ureolytica TaxID=90244 RepID=A0A378XJR6_9BURK|nr:Uncharacterised protein [Oligella ureolytica]